MREVKGGCHRTGGIEDTRVPERRMQRPDLVAAPAGAALGAAFGSEQALRGGGWG